MAAEMRPSGIVSEEEQTVVKETVRIDWRKLLRFSLMIMVLPTVSAILLDVWFKTFPYITIVAIIICFPTATILVITDCTVRDGSGDCRSGSTSPLDIEVRSVDGNRGVPRG